MQYANVTLLVIAALVCNHVGLMAQSDAAEEL